MNEINGISSSLVVVDRAKRIFERYRYYRLIRNFADYHKIYKPKMAPPVLYATDISPPCCAVFLAVAAAGIEVDIQEINLMSGDHRKKEFLEMNPQHTVPTLNDNGFIVWDSHAIATYLIDEYAKDDSLYPKDLQKRAVINQRLHFDNATLYTSIKDIGMLIVHKGVTAVPEDQLDKIRQSYEFLEQFLGANDWLAGNTYTLADISIVASVTALTAFLTLDNYPKLAAWLKRCEDRIPSYTTTIVPGIAKLHSMLAGKITPTSK